VQPEEDGARRKQFLANGGVTGHLCDCVRTARTAIPYKRCTIPYKTCTIQGGSFANVDLDVTIGWVVINAWRRMWKYLYQCFNAHSSSMIEKDDVNREGHLIRDEPSPGSPALLSRRIFAGMAAMAGSGLGALSISARARNTATLQDGTKGEANNQPGASLGDSTMSDEITKEKIRRALLSGPDSITREAHCCGIGCPRQDDRIACRY
jgi:hypothetical protein